MQSVMSSLTEQPRSAAQRLRMYCVDLPERMDLMATSELLLMPRASRRRFAIFSVSFSLPWRMRDMLDGPAPTMRDSSSWEMPSCLMRVLISVSVACGSFMREL